MVGSQADPVQRRIATPESRGASVGLQGTPVPLNRICRAERCAVLLLRGHVRGTEFYLQKILGKEKGFKMVFLN